MQIKYILRAKITKNIIGDLEDMAEEFTRSSFYEKILKAGNSERHNLYWIDCKNYEIEPILTTLKQNNIESVNIGLEISNQSEMLKSNYLPIETEEFVKKILESRSHKNEFFAMKTVAIYNTGILFEPKLSLNPTKILKDISKSIVIVLIWENEVTNSSIFYWSKENLEIGFNFC